MPQVIPEPVSDSGWQTITPAGSWSAGSSYGTPRYRRRHGRVWFKGTIAGGTGTIFTLPVGFRPPENLLFLVPANGGGLQITINASTGVVSALSYIAGGTNAIVLLNGVTFFLD